MIFHVEITSSAEKELKALETQIADRISRKLLELEDNPTHPQSKRLTPYKFYRVRVGDYRIIYYIDYTKKEIRILKIGHRKDVYKRGNLLGKRGK